MDAKRGFMPQDDAARKSKLIQIEELAGKEVGPLQKLGEPDCGMSFQNPKNTSAGMGITINAEDHLSMALEKVSFSKSY